MKRILFIAAIAGVVAVGCGNKEEELPAPAPAPAGGASVGVADPLAPATSVTQVSEAFDPAKMAPPVSMADFSAADRPVGNDGNPMKDLDYLNEVIFRVNESRGSYSPEPVPQFKTAEEQRAFDEALKKFKEPITDLNELVRIKAIKALPTAPAGKKFAVNVKTLKVELVDASAPAP